jgi:hypothetical protein
MVGHDYGHETFVGPCLNFGTLSKMMFFNTKKLLYPIPHPRKLKKFNSRR